MLAGNGAGLRVNRNDHMETVVTYDGSQDQN